MKTEPLLLLAHVHDEASFIRFLEALGEEREAEVEKEKVSPSSPYEAGAYGWQNSTIESYLEAAAAWAKATKEPFKDQSNPVNPWTRAAEILYAGKIYE